MLADRLHRTRTDTDGHDPSLFVSVRLRGSPIARDLEKFIEVFTEGAKWRVVQYTRTESGRLRYASTRLAGSPMARDLENKPITRVMS